MQAFELNVLAGFIASLLWALAAFVLIRGAFFWVVDRRGELAGWWWQITYTPVQDEPLAGPAGTQEPRTEHHPVEATPRFGGSPAGRQQAADAEESLWEVSNRRRLWSVELVRIRHRSRGLLVRRSRFKGKVWRMYHMNWEHSRQNFNRVWASAGEEMPEDHVINGTFWGKKGDAGHGVFQLIPGEDKSHWIGLFAEAEKKMEPQGTKQTQLTAPVQWIRVGSEDEQKALEKVNEPTLLRAAAEYWSWRIRVRVRHLTRNKDRDKSKWSLLAGFAYAAAAAGELSAVLAIEKEKLHQRRRPDNGGHQAG
jgi:hypothetical protein